MIYLVIDEGKLSTKNEIISQVIRIHILNISLTVPATDFDERKVFALNLDNPKSHT